MSWVRKRGDTIEHGYVEERLSAYLDGELSPRERQAIHQHLSACRACQWELDTLRQTVQWTRELPTIPVPRVFTIPAPAQAVPAPRQRRGWAPLLQGATALVALLLVVVVASDIMLTGVLPTGSVPALAPQFEAVMEQSVVDAASTRVVTEVEKEVVLESEAGVGESVAEPDQAPAPQAALPAQEPPGEPAEEQRSELAERQPPVAAEAPLAMEAAVGPTPMPEAEGMTTMGGGSPEVKEKSGEQAEAPLALVVEEAAEEAEVVADAAEPTPTVVPTAPPTEQPAATATATVAPTIVAEAQEPRSMVADDQAREPEVRQQPFVVWLRLAECALGTVFIILGTITVVTVLQRRRAS